MSNTTISPPHLSHCSLRRLQIDDAERLLRWRNSDQVRVAMLNDGEIAPAEHAAWFARILGDRSKCYLVFEYRGQAVGLAYFTDLAADSPSCAWGFYLGELALPKGLGTILCRMALDYAFGTLQVARVVAWVRLDNAKSLALHSKLGFEPHSTSDQKSHNGLATHLVLTIDRWRSVSFSGSPGPT